MHWYLEPDREYTPEQERLFEQMAREFDEARQHQKDGAPWDEALVAKYPAKLRLELNAWRLQQRRQSMPRGAEDYVRRARWTLDAILMFPAEGPDTRDEFVFFQDGEWRGDLTRRVQSAREAAARCAEQLGYEPGRIEGWEAWVRALAEELGTRILYVRSEEQLRLRQELIAQQLAGEAETAAEVEMAPETDHR